MTPLVSVIVPTYNSERYLDETLRSVLEQSRPPDEVIVVDDGSTDATERVALGFAPQVNFIAGDHVGTPKNRDRGWRAASGELIAMCDSDDLWMPRKLEAQVRWLEEDQDLDAVYCYVDEFISPDVPEVAMAVRAPLQKLAAQSASALVVRSAFIERVGGYANDFEYAESVSWYSMARAAGLRDALVPEVLVKRRIHDRNHSRGAARDQSDWLRAMREHLKESRRG